MYSCMSRNSKNNFQNQCNNSIPTHVNYCMHVPSPGPILKVCLALIKGGPKQDPKQKFCLALKVCIKFTDTDSMDCSCSVIFLWCL